MRNIAFDNETFLIERLRPAPRVVCSSFCEDGQDPYMLTHNEGLLKIHFTDLLLDDNVQLIGAYTAYDMCTMIATYPDLLDLVFEKYRKNLVTDVFLRQQIYDIASGRVYADDVTKTYTLAMLSELVLDEKMFGKEVVKGGKPWRLRYGELDKIPLADWPKSAVDYALQDAEITYRIWAESLQAQELIRHEHETAYGFFCLALIANYGMRTNAEAVRLCKAMHTEKQESVLPLMLDHGLITITKKGKDKGKRTKKTKPAQQRIVEACIKKGISVPLTKTGLALKWDKKPVELRHTATSKSACILSGDPIMLERSKYVSAEKMLSTYIPVLEQGTTGPVTTRFNMAATGRTTSGGPGDPLVGTNMQNAPRDGGIRECYRPRPGYCYLSADFSGAELHTLAQTCFDLMGVSTLGDKLNAGIDVHMLVGAQLLGISYERAMSELKDGSEIVINARQDAKAANFGYPGGLSPSTFCKVQLAQREKVWEVEKAAKLRQAWFKTFPEMDAYFDRVNADLGPKKQNVLMVNSRSKRLRKVKAFTVGANYRFQGTAGDGGMAAFSDVVRVCYTDRDSALYRSRPCNWIHDEILLEFPLSGDLHAASLELKELLENAFNYYVPDYPVEAEPVASAYWSKKAEPVFDDDGRLCVWDGRK